MKNFKSISVFLLLMVSSITLSFAQQQEEDESPDGEDETVETVTPPSQQVEKAPAPKPQVAKPQAPKPKFKPSEEISEDSPVPFPIDI